MLHRVATFCFAPRSRFFEIARVLLRLDHVASFIVTRISASCEPL